MSHLEERSADEDKELEWKAEIKKFHQMYINTVNSKHTDEIDKALTHSIKVT